jgi:hypothetical protein
MGSIKFEEVLDELRTYQKVMVKFNLEQATKAQGESICIAVLFL